MRKQTHSGFTLVEVLVTMAVVGVLGAITIGAVGSVKESAHKASDVSSARQLAAAYMMYPQEHKGKLMPSVPSQIEQQMTVVHDHTGAPITVPAVANRYVFRLLPYTDSLDAMYPGQSQPYLKELMHEGSVYDISLHPSFGINNDFLGGDYTSPRHNPAEGSRVAITTMSQCINPAEQILFISTHFKGEPAPSPYVGHVHAYAPNAISRGRGWKGSYNEEIPSNLGNIHLRYNNQAVVAHLDGSVAMLGEEELSDMRRWSNQARDRNDPDFSPR